MTSLLLWLTLFASTLLGKLDPQYVQEHVVLNAGIQKAKQDLDTERCQAAVKEEFPQFAGADRLELSETFEAKIRIVPTPLLPAGPNVKGQMNCDQGPNTILVSTVQAMWEPNLLPQTLIHEFIHALSCKETFDDWGSLTNLFVIANGDGALPETRLAREYIAKMERRAYRVGARCTGRKIPSFAKETE